MARKSHPAESIPLIPATDFRKVAARVFGTSKAESDRQLAASKKHKGKHKGK